MRITGVRVDMREFERMIGRLTELDRHDAQVGVFASEGGSASHAGRRISLVELATVHEFGTSTVPERAFIRRTAIEGRHDFGVALSLLARQVMLGRIQPQYGLSRLGAFASTQVRSRIATGAYLPPPLKPATIARKGHARPLIHTGQLLSAIRSKVGRR